MKLLIETGRRRVLIQNMASEIDAGEFPIKRIAGETVAVSANALSDGHDQLSALLKHRKADEAVWSEIPMSPLGNDRWEAAFRVPEIGRYRYTIEAWVDHFKSWQENFRKRIEAGQPLELELQIAADLVQSAAKRAGDPEGEQLQAWATVLGDGEADRGRAAIDLAASDQLARSMAAHSDRRMSTIYGRELEVIVERPRAGCGTWYEVFPRSCSPDPVRAGTLRDCAGSRALRRPHGLRRALFAADPPDRTQSPQRKKRFAGAGPNDPGSPWAIGASRVGINRYIRNWARWTISTDC